MRELALVAIGGAVGSVARVLTAGLAYRVLPAGVPWGTLVVNLIGSFAFGVIVRMASTRGGLGPEACALLLSGLLGGFTTFSAFSFDNYELVAQGLEARALVNVAVQVVIGVAAVWAGFALTRQASLRSVGLGASRLGRLARFARDGGVEPRHCA